MLDTLAKKSQDHKVRTLPPPKRPAPALPTLVSFRKPKQNPQPTDRDRVKIQWQRPFLRGNPSIGEMAVEQKGPERP